MNWVRKSFVAFLAFVMLIALLWSVSAYNVQTKLSHPDKIETWLSESKIYDHVVPAILSEAQADNDKNGTPLSVSLTDPQVGGAAQEAFSIDLLKKSAGTFIQSNYDWLSGKTTKPGFSLDFTQPKQSFTAKVGKYVTDHLSSLPVCTPEQLAQLQIPIDPVKVTCRPASLDPKTEGNRVAEEVASSDFLSKPVVTADTLGQEENSDKKPYYQDLSKLPQLYQLGQKLAWILALVAILCAAGIIFIHPSRRKGVRRVGAVLVVAGVLLIVTKFVSDVLVNKLEDSVLTKSTKAQLDQPFTAFLHKIESQLTQSNMMFGIIFIVIAVGIFIYLFAARDGRDRKPKPRQANTPSNPPETSPLSSSEDRPQSPGTSDISDRLRTPRPTGPPPLGGAPRPRPSQPGRPEPRSPRPPRLIQ